MTNTQHCPQCGAQLPANGICPSCAADFLQGDPTLGPGAAFLPPSIEDLAGKFPQLEILELLGKGGMGAVYKARQRELDRIVALKILPPGIGEDPAFADRFVREARALAKLNYPNIVTLFEFGKAPADGPYFFLMEFVDGMNLREILQAERISPREALQIVPQICDALQFAHDHGIVHRDIKPENILLDRRGRVKVADFGLAKIVGAGAELVGAGQRIAADVTEAGKILGTPSYMAPEQAERPAEVDHRADIYALGVVFYQMLTGELPAKRIVPPSRKVEVDVRLDEVVLRALEKQPELRYPQASVFKTQVETIAAANPAFPTPTSNLPEARHALVKPAIGLIASGVLQLLVFFSLLFWALSAVKREGGDPAGVAAVWFMAALSFVAAGIVIGGAISMLALRRYPLALAGSVLALVAGPAAILGLPFGVWALRVLNRREVQHAFEERARSANAERRNRSMRLLAFSCAIFFGAVLTILIPVLFHWPQPWAANVKDAKVTTDIALPQVAGRYDWSELAGQGKLLAGKVEDLEGRQVLRIENTTNAPLQLALLKIEKPAVTGAHYALNGEVKYEGVQGAGYLEMWNVFPEGRFFSRTMGTPGSGSMGQLAGTSSWREFSLPFDRTGTKNPPDRLEINIFLPGRGTVFIGPMKLVQMDAGNESAAARPSPATDSKDNRQAEEQVRVWLGLMDRGDYAEGWDMASEGFRAAVTRDEWIKNSEVVRGPLGAVVSRKLASMEETKTLPGAPDGLYLVATYDTVFEKLSGAKETVTFSKEKDGQWRAAGYFIRPAEGARKEPVLPAEKAAVSAAEQWLGAIDAGNYSQSWKDAASIFQAAISDANWSVSLTGARKPLGALVSRKLRSAQATRSLSGAPAGEYVVMQFDTSFESKKNAVETVTFFKEADGTWKAAGYYIR